MCVYVCPCVISWDLPGCCQHITQTPLKVFSPRCLSVSAPSLLRGCESLPSRPNLSSRPHKASAFPKLLDSGAPQAKGFTTGNNTEEPPHPPRLQSSSFAQESLPEGRRERELLSGNRSDNMWTVADSASCWSTFVFTCGTLCTPVEPLLMGLDLVNNPLGFSEASVHYMCTDLFALPEVE